MRDGGRQEKKVKISAEEEEKEGKERVKRGHVEKIEDNIGKGKAEQREKRREREKRKRRRRTKNGAEIQKEDDMTKSTKRVEKDDKNKKDGKGENT